VGFVTLHRHIGVGQVGPSAGARHVHLREPEDPTERRQNLVMETVEHAEGVVLLRQLGVAGIRVAREEAASDGLAEQCCVDE